MNRFELQEAIDTAFAHQLDGKYTIGELQAFVSAIVNQFCDEILRVVKDMDETLTENDDDN